VQATSLGVAHTRNVRPCMSFSQTRIYFNLVSGDLIPIRIQVVSYHIYHASYFKCHFALSFYIILQPRKHSYNEPRECLHDLSFSCQRTPFIYHRKLHRLLAVDQRGIFFLFSSKGSSRTPANGRVKSNDPSLWLQLLYLSFIIP
jgi:hypothetical protein